MKKVLIVAIVVLVAFGLFCSSRYNLVGQQYKEIKAKGWYNTTDLSIAKLQGKVVVVEFWATWCPPCRRSIPHLIKLYKKYKDKGVVFISLTSESKSRVDRFYSSRPDLKMPYPVGYGSYSSRSYGVRGIPHAVVINKNGTISWSGHPMSGGFERAIKKFIHMKVGKGNYKKDPGRRDDGSEKDRDTDSDRETE